MVRETIGQSLWRHQDLDNATDPHAEDHIDKAFDLTVSAIMFMVVVYLGLGSTIQGDCAMMGNLGK